MPLIFDIRRFSVHDGPGIRTTVFFKGCPMNCPWCHNPESRNSGIECVTRENIIGNKTFKVEETIGKEISVNDILTEILRDLPFYEESGGGVTFSGGEPLFQADALIELLKVCQYHNIHTAIDTSGYASKEVFSEVAFYNNLFLFDLKHSDNQKHIEFTGVSNDNILNNLFYLKKLNKEVIIRIPLIHGVNSSVDNLEGTLQLLLEIKSIVKRVDLLPYHSIGKKKYEKLKLERTEYPELSKGDLRLWQHELKNHGFLNSIGG